MIVQLDGAVEIRSADQFDAWLATNHATHRSMWAVIFKKATKKQTVSFDQLLDTALCWGWVDVQTKSVDDEHYGIRFVPRKPGSNWSVTNRSTICRLIAEGRVQPNGMAQVPADLVCD